MSYEERQKNPNPPLNTKICTETLNKIEIYIDACDKEMYRKVIKYNRGGIKKLYRNNNKDIEKWNSLPYSHSLINNQVIWKRGSNVKPNVQCSATAVSTNQRCKNTTTNCSGRCYLHG
jgi:hypothetical protein